MRHFILPEFKNRKRYELLIPHGMRFDSGEAVSPHRAPQVGIPRRLGAIKDPLSAAGQLAGVSQSTSYAMVRTIFASRHDDRWYPPATTAANSGSIMD
jgi:hypothetical protein